ncbi:MAG: hypothetical protein PHW03_06370 [Eubacteriales bacterium]|nr:hypothetical protein [Eubacteriales bacterium]MDD4390413.1 hypothetical protein [Eubacteriales bacterium]
MEYMKYQRSFVMLEEQNKKFAMKQGETSRGHIKIETGGNKGALRIGVENIESFQEREYVYKLILFGKSDSKTIYAIVGTVRVGSLGSGESYFRFNPLDMDGKGNDISKYTHAIVAAVSTKNEDEPLHPILKGTISIKGEETELQNFEEKKRDEAELNGAKLQKEDTKEDKQEDVRTFNSFYREYLLKTCRNLEEEADVYNRIIPFKEDVTSAAWSKIDNPDELPLVTPKGKELSRKYKHYIFGVSQEHYYIGIPGRFLKEEQPDEGGSGFVLWQPIVGAEKLNATDADCPDKERMQAYGYWIVAITKIKGDIIEA